MAADPIESVVAHIEPTARRADVMNSGATWEM